MNRTAWIVIGLLCILGIGGLVYMTKKDSVNVDTINPATIIEASETSIGDRVYGKKDAKVIVFEYADFQCPGCLGAHGNTPRIQELYKDKIAFVYRNFPLTSSHPNAMAAASVAEAAGLQNKYWEMNNLLFDRRSEWAELSSDTRGDKFLEFAGQLKLNIDQFKTDLAGSLVQKKIQTDRALGGKVNVSATPTFFIGDKQVDEATTANVISSDGSKLMDLIDEALKAAGETPPTRNQ